jgi:hypothetical protein
MALQFTTSYIEDSLTLFRQCKKIADGAMEQLADEQLYAALAGNMRSRWTDFLTTDGEKPDRNRDSEFQDPPAGREALLKLWEQGWTCLFHALESLTDADLTRTITIRGEAHSVMQAINRQVSHYSLHCGQIIFLAKHLRGAGWKSLSVPRGASAQFNEKVRRGEASQR